MSRRNAGQAPAPRHKPVAVQGSLLQRQCNCRNHTAGGGICPQFDDAPVKLQRHTANGWSRRAEVPPVVHEVLHSPGQPLDRDIRTYMEARLGHDFSRVRTHSDARAAQSAQAVDASAYAVGHDVVFGMGRYRPGSADGTRLLAHELAHVVQQSRFSEVRTSRLYVGAPLSPAEAEADHAADAVARGAAATVTPIVDAPLLQRNGPSGGAHTTSGQGPVPDLPPTESFEQMWGRFERLLYAGRQQEALALAPALVGSMGLQDTMKHGMELAHWLLQQGQLDLASQTIADIESAWWAHYVTDHVPEAALLEFSGVYGPRDLIEEARAQAASNRDEQVRQLLGVAYLMLQMQYRAYTDTRVRELNQLAGVQPLPTAPDSATIDFPFIRLLSYTTAGQMIHDMREILGFYSVREREATAQGRSRDAARDARLGKELRDQLREQYVLTGTGDAHSGITMEATYGVNRRRGPGYTLHGAHGRETFVTPLPGEPLPDELGTHTYYSASMQEMFEQISGQEDLLTELLSHPEVRRRFHGRPIDMNDLQTRLIIWHEMFAVFQRQPAAGCSNALCSLLRLIERYLQHFTVHTGYNIEDFGRSYIGRKFPEDLLGRVVRDCGVYAVTVAYEVYRTARTATPRLPVHLQLFSTLEHFMLIIRDDATQEHYVVSNDQIVGPRSGDPAATAASIYAGMMGHPFGVSAGGAGVSLDTNLSDAAFRRRLWRSYETGARLGIEPGRQPGDTRPQGERENDAYRDYYNAMTRFDQAAQAAFVRLQQLMADFPQDPASRNRALAAALPLLDQTGLVMKDIIDAMAHSPHIGLRPGPNLPVQRQVLLTSPRGVDVHPLARIGKALLFAEHHGHTLTPDERALLAWLRHAPFPSLSNELVQYDLAGRPPRF